VLARVIPESRRFVSSGDSVSWTGTIWGDDERFDVVHLVVDACCLEEGLLVASQHGRLP